MSRWSRVAVPLLLLGTLACGKMPPTHYYMLKVQDTPRAVSDERGAPVIGVQSFRVDPPYDEDRIVYRIGPDSLEVGYYAYHRWAVPLSRMLAHVVAEGLRDTAGVGKIEVAAPGVSYDRRLVGRVLELEEIDVPEGPRVAVRILLTLVDGDGDEIWSEIVGGERPTAATTVAEIVHEMNGLLAEAVEQGRRGFERALAR